MRLFAFRLLAVTTLALLYQLNSTLGIAALAASFGYVIAVRRYTPTPACESEVHSEPL